MDFPAFLAEVRRHYWGWHGALLRDEDPCHTAKASLKTADGMTLLGLPKRALELNPMDTLWGQGKDVVCANKQYKTIDEQVERFLKYLSGLSGREALHTSGVLSHDFCREVLKHSRPLSWQRGGVRCRLADDLRAAGTAAPTDLRLEGRPPGKRGRHLVPPLVALRISLSSRSRMAREFE